MELTVRPPPPGNACFLVFNFLISKHMKKTEKVVDWNRNMNVIDCLIVRGQACIVSKFKKKHSNTGQTCIEVFNRSYISFIVYT